jgi:hypothetical protein
MASPDAQARLAYLDLFPLLNTVIDPDWNLYADALIDHEVWRGRVIELQKIRNRIGHCRRPHPDDLGRLEQTLRDLDAGAFRAATSLNRQWGPDHDLADPLVDAWIHQRHADAARLVDHANNNYDVRFLLLFSRRPWAPPRNEGEPISGRSGYLWHARFILAGGDPLDLPGFWDDSYLAPARELLVYVCANNAFGLDISFAAVDDSGEIGDAIGNCFDAVLTNLHPGRMSFKAWEEWPKLHRDLDPRVQVDTEWSVVDDSTTPITMFGA